MKLSVICLLHLLSERLEQVLDAVRCERRLTKDTHDFKDGSANLEVVLDNTGDAKKAPITVVKEYLSVLKLIPEVASMIKDAEKAINTEEGDDVVLPVRVYSFEGLTLNNFNIKRDSYGLDYIESITPIFPTQTPVNGNTQQTLDITPAKSGMFSTENGNIQVAIDNKTTFHALDIIDEAIRTNSWDDASVNELENLNNEDYGKILKRFSQEELGGSNENLIRAETIIQRGGRGADSENTSSNRERTEQQEQQVEAWAKENGLWYNDYQESKDGSLESVIEADGYHLSDKSGSESLVFFSGQQ